MIVTIEGRLAGLNELISSTNKGYRIGNALKQEMTTICETYFRQQCNKTFEKIFLTFHWYEKNQKRDKDNICSAKKYILDGMIKAGIIKNDGWKNIEGFEDRFFIDKENPRVEIRIKEI